MVGIKTEGSSARHELMINTVHAFLVESGFVGFQSVSGIPVGQFRLPGKKAFTVSLCYTLPEILGINPCHRKDNLTETSVVLKFLSLGNFVIVYGSLANEGQAYRLCLDKNRFLPTTSAKASSLFGRIVKDGLALPLLIDLCEKVGLPPPPCLAGVPPELKLKIMELLPGNDIAKLECVCKEFRNLSYNDDVLWKQKLEEKYGNFLIISKEPRMTSWKKRFVSDWEKMMTEKKKKKAAKSISVQYVRCLRNCPIFMLPQRVSQCCRQQALI